MVNLIRRFQQPLMIFITVIVIIAFAWLYNTNRMDRGGSDQIGTIYGRKVGHAEFSRGAKKFELARDLRMFDLLEPLVGQAMSMDQATENYIWNSLILEHEADALGIQSTNAEVQDFIKAMPVFQTSGRYDSNLYVQFVNNALSYRGLSEDQLFELVRDNLKLRKIKDVLGATASAAPAEIRSAYEGRNQKTEASVVRLKLDDFLKTVTVSEEDLKKTFEERKASLTAPEKRKVKFVGFTLANEEKPAVGKERIEKMQKLADQAGEFAIAMAEKDATLEKVAEKFNVQVQTSPEFSAQEPPKELSQSEQVAQAAFNLTKEQPNSDAVNAENGYYVLQLADITPSRPLTFEEAKAKLEESLKDERGREALSLKATEIRNKIVADVKAGKSAADAAKDAGATLEAFPAFSMAEPKMDQPDAREVMVTAMELQAGETSEPVPTATGSLIVHVDKKLPVDETKFETEKTMISQSITRSRREALFREWMKDRRTEANIMVPRRNERNA